MYGKLSTKLLLEVANKNTKFMFTETGLSLFLKYVFRDDCSEKFSTKTSIGWKGNYPKTRSTEIYKTSSLGGCDFGENNCDTQCIQVCFFLVSILFFVLFKNG